MAIQNCSIDYQALIDSKCKPPQSLGTLESWAIKLCRLQASARPSLYPTAKALLFAADHGITSTTPEVTAYPRAVTVAVYKAIAAGIAASSVLCEANNCELELIDMGVDASLTHIASGKPHINVHHGSKVRANGSRCMQSTAALSEDEMALALDAGKEAVDRYVESVTTKNPDIKPSQLVLCIGELGMGNTTSAAAILSAACTPSLSAEATVGRGTGVNAAGLQVKRDVVEKALEFHADLIAQKGARGILQAVGGLEMAAMVGAYLRAAEYRMPTLVDGFVSGAAALLALKWDNDDSFDVEGCLFWAHKSQEQAAGKLLQAAAAASRENCDVTSVVDTIEVPLQMQLRLGEGTGAILALPLLRSAAAIASHMGSLEEALLL